jgi:DNA-binding HxlR family transcriptional regulator
MRRIQPKSVEECPVEITLRHIGGAWKALIIYHLASEGRHRHSELMRRLSGVTAKILTQQLREMERDGLVQRRVYPEVPPRVEYKLTTRGETLRPIIDAMCSWGTKQGQAMKDPNKLEPKGVRTPASPY